jgi:2-isopropylmalate synthase
MDLILVSFPENLYFDLPCDCKLRLAKVVQKMAESKGRELLLTEITELFQHTYSLTKSPRFNIVDYAIMTGKSKSPATPEPGKT